MSGLSPRRPLLFKRHHRAIILGHSTRSLQEVTAIFETFAKEADPVEDAASAPAKVRRDDKAMLRAAADVTRDLNVPDALIYGPIFSLGSDGYAALALAATTANSLVMLAAGLVTSWRCSGPAASSTN